MSRNQYTQAIAGPESAFDAPLFPTHSSHLYCHERAGGAPKLSLPPGAGNPTYATAADQPTVTLADMLLQSEAFVTIKRLILSEA